MDFNKLESRYKTVEQELSFAQRKREEEALAAEKTLSDITDEMVEKLMPYLPEIKTIRSFTKDDIIKNDHNEIGLLQEVYGTASKLLDQWLTQLEETIK